MLTKLLSTAILEGCKLSPRQAYGYYNVDGATCAMGAAQLAVGYIVTQFNSEAADKLTQLWAGHDDRYHQLQLGICPACSKTFGERCWSAYLMHNLVPHLNDNHRWTREHIAEYVAEQEFALGIHVDPVPTIEEPINDPLRITCETVLAL